MVRRPVIGALRAARRSWRTLVASGVLTAIVVFVAAVIGVGQTGPPPPGPPDPYAHTKYAIVWSDPAGLDLMSPEGTYVRATVESGRVSADNGDPAVAMPGFWGSLNTVARGPLGTTWTDDEADDLRVGIVRYAIVDVIEDGETLHVTVCEYDDQLGTRMQSNNPDLDGRYQYWRGSGGVVQQLTINRAGATAPPSRQSGPQTFGTTPVFGTWKTTDWDTTRTVFDPNPCRGRSLPEIVADQHWYYTTEIPTAPSFPGWPVAL